MVCESEGRKSVVGIFHLVRFNSSLKRRMLFHQLRNLTVVRFGEARSEQKGPNRAVERPPIEQQVAVTRIQRDLRNVKRALRGRE